MNRPPISVGKLSYNLQTKVKGEGPIDMIFRVSMLTLLWLYLTDVVHTIS